MIMCHKNARQVIRLAERCVTHMTDVFIHADKNMPEGEYSALQSYATSNSNVYLTEHRHHGELDMRSLCDIAIELIRRAKQVECQLGKHYCYYVLLSGQDYLIKPIEQIESELLKCYPKPLIDCTPYSKTNWIYWKFIYAPSAIRYHRWVGSFPESIVKHGLRVTEIIYRKITRLLGISSYRELCAHEIALFGGSTWWMLPDIVIDYILDEVDKTQEYIQILLDKTRTPDETFFQIMTMRSPLADMVDINPIDMVAQNCKTWAYFSDEGKPFKGHPYIFTVEEFDKLKASPFWIARKFDETVDSVILDLIDSELLNGETK